MPALSIPVQPPKSSGASFAGDWLDTLRGLAATSVVFFHLNETIRTPQQPYNSILKQGYYGVPIFFVLSGYLIVLTALKRPEITGFLHRRAWRIYPPYLASLAVVIAAVMYRKLATGFNDVTHLPQTLPQIFATLTLMTEPVTSIRTVNWIYWSLSCEVVFYAFVALFLFRRAKLLPWAIAGAVVVGIWPVLPAWLGFFTGYWWEFAVGSTLAIGVHRPASWVVLAGGALTAVVGQHYFAGAIVFATWLTILWSKQASGAWLNQDPVFSRVGKVSYSLYLIHVPIGVYLFQNWVPATWYVHFGTHLLVDLTLYAICLGAAVIFWRTVELPSHRRGQRRR